MSLFNALQKSDSQCASARATSPQVGQWLKVAGLAGVVPLMMACGGSGPGLDGSEPPPPAPVPLETGAGTIQGYNDYSYDKNTVLFPTRANGSTVFFDSFQPFDTTLRYVSDEPIVRYRMELPTRTSNGVLMVALSDLRKVYAPYFSYTVDESLNNFTATHHLFRKRVTAGAGSRSPTVQYTKMVFSGSYSLTGAAATSFATTHVATTNSNQINASGVTQTTGPRVSRLDASPQVVDGKVYVPVASFLQTMGKTITDASAASGYLAASSVGPDELTDDLFNPSYDRGYSYQPLSATRIAYMDGVLSGTKTHGNMWDSFYMGDIASFTGNYDAGGQDITTDMSVDRVIPYRVYVPTGYRTGTASKFTFNLHGGTGHENSPFERPNDHLANLPQVLPGVNTLEKFADHYDYLIASPNGWTRNPQWGTGPGEKIMLEMHRRVKADYSVDDNRTFVFGNSLGGAGTMNFAIRHPQLFRAMAPTAPAPGKPNGSAIRGPVVNIPTWLSCFTEDITVPYAGSSSNCQPWYQAQVAGTLSNVTFVTIENGHHSYGPASTYQMMFDFFERVLTPSTPRDVNSVAFQVGNPGAVVTATGGATSVVTLENAPYNQGGVVMVALSDLARVYGPDDFKTYNVSAYNNSVADMVSVSTVIFNKTSVNLKPGNIYLRVGGTVKEGDTTSGSARVPAGSPTIDPRALSVPSQVVGGNLYVPVVEFMQLFGKTASAS